MITPQEIIRHAPISKSYDEKLLCNFMPATIDNAFRCFSPNLLRDMTDALTDTTTVTEYAQRRTYAFNDKVYFGNNGVYVSLVANNDKPPTDKLAWGCLGKFDNACLNEFWNKRMVDYLATCIVIETLPFASHSITGIGVTSRNSSNLGVETAKKEDYESVLKALIRREITLRRAVIDYVKQTECLKQYYVECSVCEQPQRVGFASRNGGFFGFN